MPMAVASHKPPPASEIRATKTLARNINTNKLISTNLIFEFFTIKIETIVVIRKEAINADS
jgi:hypothetical protein